MDVKYLHTGEPVLVLEDGSGEPGTWHGTGANAQWVANGDYKPSRVVRLGVIEDAEPGQIVDSLDATSTIGREAAIAAGELGDRPTDVQYVHEAATEASTGGSPVVGVDPAGAPLRDESVAPIEGAAAEEQREGALSDADRAELEQLRHEAAQRAAQDADPTRDTTPTL